MRIVKQGETVARTTTVNVGEQLVVKHHVTKHKDGTLYEMDWTFDYSGCTDAEILEVASRDSVIKARNAFKLLSQSQLEAWETRTFNVAAMLTHERAKVSELDKSQRANAKLNKDELMVVKQQLEALIAAAV